MTETPTPRAAAGESEFYVNYFPIPPRLRAWLRLAVPIVVSLLALIAAAAALGMRHPGSGAWPEDHVALEGVVIAEPWAVIRVRDQDGAGGDGWSSVLIVEYGKLGADRAIAQAGVAGRLARVHGTIIERDGRRMLELAPRAGAIEDLGPPPGGADLPAGGDGGLDGDGDAAWAIVRGPAMTIEGEIVDPKCYLGAMRPGQGEVHRSCARVCIAGGIPAGLIAPGAPNADGSPGPDRFCLLLDPAGAPLGEAALAWVGRPVKVSGTIEWWDELVVLRVATDGISALD